MRVAILALLVFCSLRVNAQDTCVAILQGHVVDAHNNEPLGFATVRILSLNLAVLSDAEGHYEFIAICNGNYQIECQHLSCETLFDTVKISGDTHHDFYPEHHTEILDAIHLVDHHRTDHSELEDAVMNEMIGLSVSDQLETVTGLNALKTGGNVAKPIINGLHSTRVVILDNGVKQEGQQWGADHGPELDPFSSKNIKVIKGASGVLYGPNAIGGVVITELGNIATEKPLETKVFLSGASNGRQGNVALQNEGSFKKIHGLKWRTHISNLRSGNSNAPSYFLDNTGSHLRNAIVQLSYGKSQFQTEMIYGKLRKTIGIFSGSHIGNLTDLQTAFEADKPFAPDVFSYEIKGPYQEVLHETFKYKIAYLFKSSKVEVDYSRQFNKRQEFDSHSGEKPDIDLNLTTQAINALWVKPSENSISFKFGSSGAWQKNTSGARLFIPNFTKNTFGMFGLATYRKPFWKWEVGLRGDVVSQKVYHLKSGSVEEYHYDYKQPSASFAVTYKKGNWLWQQTLSTGWRPPHVSELFADGVHHGAASFEIGDTSLLQEIAYSYRNEMDYVKGSWHLKLEPWANYIIDYIFLEPQLEPTLTIRGAFPTFKYKQTDALLFGLSVQSDYLLTESLKYEVSINITRGRNLNLGDHLVMMPVDDLKQRLQYTFKDNKAFKDNYMAFEWNYSGKQWRVPENSDYVAPPSGYALLNCRVGTNVSTSRINYQINFGIDNLFNVAYRNYLNRLRYYSDDLGRNIRLSLILKL
jgi:iron complex outermembrane receptor protein